MKIIITERIAEEGIDLLKNCGHEVNTEYKLSAQELLDIIPGYDAIIVRSATKVNAELLQHASNLKVVGRAGNGIDNIDVDACTKRGIVVVNTPESNIMAAAELAIGLAFALFRNIPQAIIAGRNGNFRRNTFIGNELDGKIAGIIGLGRIGSIVAKKLRGCNMKVIAYDPYINDEKFKMLSVEKCETLEDLLKKADLITLHTPKTEETYGMIGEREISLCKDGVRFVNAARGGLISEKALCEAIKSGKVHSAGLDVLEPEPNYEKSAEEQNYYNSLLTMDNVFVTPHLGASTEEANFNVGTDVASLVADALDGKMVAAVNMPHMNGHELNGLRPYITLAEMLGKMYYQTEKEPPYRIDVIYKGELANHETKIITLSALKGFMEPVRKEKINFVNAETMLKNMGICYRESKSSDLDKYTNLITLQFVTDRRTLSLSGTIFAKEEMRIVDFFGYKLDFEPTPFVLAIQNIDRPGIIGKIGTTLGNADANIAAMQWSRNRKGEKAVAFVSVDSELSQDVLNKLKELDGVLRVSMIRF